MSTRGWPKGKKRGRATSPARREADKKFIRAAAQRRRNKKVRSVEISSGLTLGGGLNENFSAQRAHLDISPAAWKSAHVHVGDSQYVDDGLDDVLLRALEERVLYASSTCCHREPLFQDVTVHVIAAVELAARKGGPPPPPIPGRAKERPVVVTRMIEEEEKPPLVFTARQRQIVAVIAAGMAAEEAARRLGIAPRTVKMHADKLRKKLNVRTRREVPLAFFQATGENVFAMLPEPTVEIAETTPQSRKGKGLLEVVSEMFES